MDDPILPSKSDPQYEYVVAQFGGPAFMRRAQRAEQAVTHLLQHLRQRRAEMLAMVRLRLGQVHALAGGWSELSRFIPPESLTTLRHLFDELKPQLRMPVAATEDPATIRSALRDLCEALVRFNDRWRDVLAAIDLRDVNQRRDEYNRFYVLEKECFVRSARVARAGFRPLEPVTVDHLEAWLPTVADLHILAERPNGA